MFFPLNLVSPVVLFQHLLSNKCSHTMHHFHNTHKIHNFCIEVTDHTLMYVCKEIFFTKIMHLYTSGGKETFMAQITMEVTTLTFKQISVYTGTVYVW